MKAKKILVLSDLHCGHRAGLTPPSWSPKTANSAPRGAQKNARARDTLWEWFRKNYKKRGPYDAAIVNGDAIEGQGWRSGGTELITSDREEQVDIAADILRGIAPKIYMTYGTGYHAGQEEDWENILALRIGAKKIEAEGHYTINGLSIAAKHHIANTSVPNSRHTALNRASVRNLLWHEREQQPLADIIIRSHVHRWSYCGDSRFMAFTTPALQGLGSKYGARRCDGMPVDFGFVVLTIRGKHDYDVDPVIMPMTAQRAEVNEI